MKTGLQALVRGKRSAILWICALLAGCAALEQQTPIDLPDGVGFFLSGRISMKYGSEAASGLISWRHTPASDDLLLSSPMGQGMARVVRRDAMVRLTTADKQEYQAEDAESLTEKVLGWRLPLAGLPEWVRARAVPGSDAQTRSDAAQRLVELKQSGWLVEFLEYDDRSGLPLRLRLTRGDVEIRLAITGWRGAT